MHFFRKIRKFSKFNLEINLERDKSHSIEHFARVEAFIKEIIKDVGIMNKIKDIHKSDFEVRKFNIKEKSEYFLAGKNLDHCSLDARYI